MSEYHILQPVSSKDTYDSQSNIDFNISLENKQMVANSLRIEGVINFNQFPKVAGNDNIDFSRDFNYDGVIGAHACFQSINISADKYGALDQNQYYPLTVKALRVAKTDRTDLSVQSSNICELTSHEDKFTKYIMAGNAPKLTAGASGNANAVFGSSIDFSIKPVCALNNSSNNISYSKVGNIDLHLRVNGRMLYGADSAGITYTLSNVRLTYRTLPDSKQVAETPLVMKGFNTDENKIENNIVNLSSKPPAVCDGVVVVFHDQKTIGMATKNDYELQYPPNMNRVEFSFNDSTLKYFSFVLEDESEMLYWAMQALGGSKDKNGVRYSDIRYYGNNYMVGLPFPATDLSQQAFSIQVRSGIQNAIPYECYLLFTSLYSI